jgi:hypothetical protein
MVRCESDPVGTVSQILEFYNVVIRTWRINSAKRKERILIVLLNMIWSSKPAIQVYKIKTKENTVLHPRRPTSTCIE